ncbi:hypothetical protein K7X08_028883 [Anisodus acutangulus]|uniref:Uncharacterized protein n=1 Tax=Anisodus acutangulus TaxID=402998 RepID=A0A9Q1L3G6_9SOLA|nr:hypothetical protein K7X08_028883 [Anisodus acutangulus]
MPSSVISTIGSLSARLVVKSSRESVPLPLQEIWRLRTATVLASCGSSKTRDLTIKVFMKCSKSASALRVCKEKRRLKTGLHEKLVPMVHCLETLGSKPQEVASAITKFPHILSHSVEEKLCPLLAFFEALGITEKQLGKMILINPRIISYSIQHKLSQMVEFLSSLHLSKDGMIGKVLVKHPYIMGYSVDKRLRPTSEFLKSIGLTDMDLQKVAVNYPEVLCRDVNKILKPNLSYLTSRGFGVGQIAAVVTCYPPVLIKSVSNSLEPRIKFLIDVMGRRLDEVVDYPDYFRHSLKRRLESRHKLLMRKNISCTLSEMLDCNQKKFLFKFGLVQ